MKKIRGNLLTGAFLLIALLFSLFLIEYPPPFDSIVTLALLFFFGMSLMMLLFHLSISRKIAARIRAGEGKQLLGRYSLTLKADYLLEESKGRKSGLPYEEIQSIVTYRNLILIMQSPSTAYIVPENSFSTEAEKRKFLNFLRKRTGL